MPDIILPSGLIKPGIGSTSYGAKLNGNWDLMNGLVSRVVTLEAIESASPYIDVPMGSSGSDLQTICNDAPVGSTIVLPAGDIIQTSSLRIIKDLKVIGHASGISKLKINGDVTAVGSARQIMVGWDQTETMGTPINFKLSGFTMEHDRILGGSGMRTVAITMAKGIASADISHMKFLGITNDVCNIVNHAQDPTGIALNVAFHDNLITEWYESLFLTRCGWADKIWIYNNIGTTSAANPNASISRPYGVAIDMENSFGEFTNITVCNNSFTNTIAYEQNGNSFGVVVHINDVFEGYVTLFDKIFIHNNYLDGWYMGGSFRSANLSTENNGSLIVFADNDIRNSDSYPISVRPDGVHATDIDYIYILRNHALIGGGGPSPDVDLTFAPDYNVHLANNFYEGTW
jgi:hypothetical protein